MRQFNNKVLMWKKYLTFKYLMCFFAVVLAVVNLTLFGYHIYREANTAFKVSHDTTYLMVQSVHFGIALFLSLSIAGMCINRLWSWLAALGTLLSTLGIYASWYLEKFDFMKGFECTFEAPECQTIIEANFIRGIELFRLETRLDVFSLVGVFLLLFYVSFKIWKQFVAPNIISLR